MRLRYHLGFSIIELMVSVSLIAILLSIIIPSPARARIAANQVIIQSNLRQLGHSIELYAGTHDSQYPFMAWDADYHAPEYAQIGASLVLHPFRLRHGWPFVFEHVAPWREHYATWINPGVPHTPGVPWETVGPSGRGLSWDFPSYMYSHAFTADPRLFRPGGEQARPQTVRLIRAVRNSEVAFPSSKAMMFEEPWAWDAAAFHKPSGVLAADGAAAFRVAADAIPPVEHPWRFSGAFTYADTPEGVHGRDW